MNKINKILLGVSLLVLGGCDLDRFPESQFTDAAFWNTESDLMNAANRHYQLLTGFQLDNRGDDNVNQTANNISNGSRNIPATSGDWSNAYRDIFTANNILEKGVKAQVAESVKNRYFGEARFFRAMAYFGLVQKYGDVPLVLKTLDIDSPELRSPRSPKEEVLQAIYDDLDFAAQWLPGHRQLPAAQYGRVTKSSALALKARVALYAGTRAKFHNDGDGQKHLRIAVDAAQAVIAQGHSLYPSYHGLFQHEAEGPNNTENIFVKIYGVSVSNLIVGHSYSRDMENGRNAPTRNLLRQYLYADGLPAYTTENQPSSTRSSFFVPEKDESSYNTIFENRDPRLGMTVFKAGEDAYKGPWVPTTTLGSRTAYAAKKGFNLTDWQTAGSGTVDKILIRYGEVLLILAEAKYELEGQISDADLNLTINALRKRAGFNVMLTNEFVINHNLNMREEIRRERTVELALEGFRYDDLIRWKTAEIHLPGQLLGAKFVAADWPGADPSTLRINGEGILVTEDTNVRTFKPGRDYYYPIPLQEITLSGGKVTQNPNWQ
ncbi:RagB/SusD domain protein [Leadbetterella byssophila DSM 17132]|uniref:RagB/SusD domain protein n=1 Tax=Leadbetterella byssophila (strain DSM 17132 / JCM 16389 / KACC 11308 / NBRC 106382 / 4M15) TaxID=649349 RepID=E4RR86_LEAB4|nr:RagB/SusD family nutrient uptake outer membrane protein [Leadbetterella byssophila]ADQ17572.1 RagB/SusD domain protein [Leadbetterella byssophila DSM 17132]